MHSPLNPSLVIVVFKAQSTGDGEVVSDGLTLINAVVEGVVEILAATDRALEIDGVTLDEIEGVALDVVEAVTEGDIEGSALAVVVGVTPVVRDGLRIAPGYDEIDADTFPPAVIEGVALEVDKTVGLGVKLAPTDEVASADTIGLEPVPGEIRGVVPGPPSDPKLIEGVGDSEIVVETPGVKDSVGKLGSGFRGTGDSDDTF